jgi:hypothetical protein
MLITARIFLVLDALIFLLVGIFMFTGPASMENLDIVALSGTTAIRTWGGLLFGVGLTGLLAACRTRWVAQGLVLMLIVGSMIVCSRLYGMAVDGIDPKQIQELSNESLGPVLAAIGLVLLWVAERRAKQLQNSTA